ncbi:MAG: tRNA-dihydrouridine synthase [Candidatus Kerfeldbacteria bacterium]|nr:tRNA-dihydrouridine synthase [Candidatus Kerfeldbacteria bacterium]
MNFWRELKRPILALAPMEGITDSAFRTVAKQQGADVVYTEFISSDAIDHGSTTALHKMDFQPAEQPVVCQIFGRDLAAFQRAARIVEDRGFAGLDINFGCPARKVVSHGSGVALMRDPAYCRRLIEAVLDVITIPLSIKVRVSIRTERPEVAPDCPDVYTVLDLIEAIRDLPVAAIMVHGRSFERGFDGAVDTAMIQAVKQRFPGVVLANGGVRTPLDAVQMLSQTKADGVGIARGALGQPWIFQQTKAYLQRHPLNPVSWQTVTSIATEHAVAAVQHGGPRALVEFRKHLAWYMSGVPGAAAARRQLPGVNQVADVQALLATLPA